MVCSYLFHYLFNNFGVKNNGVSNIKSQQESCESEALIYKTLADKDKRIGVTVFRDSNGDPGYDKKEDLQIKNIYENKI